VGGEGGAPLQPVARTQLVEARKRQQWSQQEVADRLGTTQHNVSRWERGETRPGAYFRAKLCALFGMSAEELDLLSTAEGEASAPRLSSASPSSSLPPVWLVPYPRNPYFTGREDLLKQVEQYLTPRARGINDH
jgi:transcriptional regulator with XRE-family HTH domain